MYTTNLLNNIFVLGEVKKNMFCNSKTLADIKALDTYWNEFVHHEKDNVYKYTGGYTLIINIKEDMEDGIAKFSCSRWNLTVDTNKETCESVKV